MRRALSAAGLLLIATACAPKSIQYPVFKPLSYRSELPRVSFYPPAFTYPGREVIVVARPLTKGEACLRIIDRDAFVWFESCWEDGTSERIEWVPMRTGVHHAYLAYRGADDDWLTTSNDKASICVMGEDAGCP